MRLSGHALEKTGVALLLGGGLNNLYDRYTKGHVVDYFHLNFGPKWLRAIVFNISDFCIFIGHCSPLPDRRSHDQRIL